MYKARTNKYLVFYIVTIGFSSYLVLYSYITALDFMILNKDRTPNTFAPADLDFAATNMAMGGAEVLQIYVLAAVIFIPLFIKLIKRVREFLGE